MSYGTCKRKETRYKCPVCGDWDWHSPMEKVIHRISAGKSNRYLCSKCFIEKLKREATQAGEESHAE
jgi:ribosomal protein L37AE/L43A